MKYNYTKWLIDKRKLDPKNNKMDRWLLNLLEKNNKTFYHKNPFLLECRKKVRMKELQNKNK